MSSLMDCGKLREKSQGGGEREVLRELKVALANQLLQVYFSIFIKKFSDNVQVNIGHTPSSSSVEKEMGKTT